MGYKPTDPMRTCFAFVTNCSKLSNNLHVNSWIGTTQLTKKQRIFETALNEVTIPRCLILGLPNDSQKELHVFCDASQYVYAAVAYLKITDKTGSFKTSVVMGKS